MALKIFPKESLMSSFALPKQRKTSEISWWSFLLNARQRGLKTKFKAHILSVTLVKRIHTPHSVVCVTTTGSPADGHS